MGNYDEFADILFTLSIDLSKFGVKRGGFGSGAEINYFGSGSFRPNNFGSGRIRNTVKKVEIIVASVFKCISGIGSWDLH